MNLDLKAAAGPRPAAEMPDEVRLRLFVSGATPRSLRAIAAIHNLCETKLAGRYRFEVVDAYRDPAVALAQGIVALPTLLQLAPAPQRLFIGDMSNTAPIEAGLGLAS